MPATREQSQFFLNVFKSINLELKSIDLELFQALAGSGMIRNGGLILPQAPSLGITLELREVGISSI